MSEIITLQPGQVAVPATWRRIPNGNEVIAALASDGAILRADVRAEKPDGYRWTVWGSDFGPTEAGWRELRDEACAAALAALAVTAGRAR